MVTNHTGNISEDWNKDFNLKGGGEGDVLDSFD